MPTYEYKCLDCNYVFEEFQKMTDEPLVECPKCHGKLKRLIGAGMAPIFKGSGFYETDYKKETNNKATNNSSKDTKPKDSKPKESKTENKTSEKNK